MNTEILGIIVMFIVTLLLGLPLGKYIAKVYGNEKTWLDPLFQPLERFFYRVTGINPNVQMTWQQHLVALLTIN
ncbi:MAG TPA: potassium-transporting ATPase subunit KdpA, partial [Sphingobacterium sp.]|nr:potassium-transporting ATPase subunit KdpA [Sphingobacterium sp.]